ncbi:hypothetical protein [Nonomuraea terrae]|uniref:hypothetical protein n=1 Tax=Nonomuraea terrae TaxID=2530383 RepID=UPI00140527D0|nr:hypothetical protein [Nonomuraea terrae]
MEAGPVAGAASSGQVVVTAAPGAVVGVVAAPGAAGAGWRLVGTPASASLRSSRSTRATGSPNLASTLATSRGFRLPCRSASILARNRRENSSRWSALSTPWAASAALET